jgi:hypothetical protein
MSTWSPKKVGSDANPLRLTSVDRLVIRERHFPREPEVCNFCQQAWPCDAAQLLHDIEATEAAFRRMVTMPF